MIVCEFSVSLIYLYYLIIRKLRESLISEFDLIMLEIIWIDLLWSNNNCWVAIQYLFQSCTTLLILRAENLLKITFCIVCWSTLVVVPDD